MKDAIKAMKGELTRMVLEIVSILVSPIIQQQLILQQSLIKSETSPRKRMGRDSIYDNISEES